MFHGTQHKHLAAVWNHHVHLDHPNNSSEALTRPFLGGHPRALQVGGLNEDGSGVQSVGGESVEAVLRDAGGDGDLVLSFAGGCRAERNQENRIIDSATQQTERQILSVTFTVIKCWLGTLATFQAA